jgi:dTMP kinase
MSTSLINAVSTGAASISASRGKFISLEGGEGAGKSTLLAGLRDVVEQHGIKLVQTREPGGTSLGEAVRAIVLDPARSELAAETELLLMFASRAQLVREVIEPALHAGHWVLCDRFADASYAYQGAGRGQPMERIAELERWACAGVKPDLTLLLDLPVATGRARAASRGDADRIEIEADSFFERVRASYRERAVAEPDRFRVIDASQSPAAVLREATLALASLVGVTQP